MNFNEFENRMLKLGHTTLAEIARALDTTPQAVSKIGNLEIMTSSYCFKNSRKQYSATTHRGSSWYCT